MITIKEIAFELGVSPTTVSNVINGRTGKMSQDTRKRIEEALIKYDYKREEKNYIGANELKLVTVDFNMRLKEKLFTDPFCAELLDSICMELKQYGRYPVCESIESADEAYTKLKTGNVEGGIIVGFDPWACEAFAEKVGKPVVFVDCGEGDYDNVGIEDYEGGRMITEYLLKQGHRKIAFFCDRKSPASSTLDRFQGYCDALKKYNITYNNKDYFYLPDNKTERREQLRRFARLSRDIGHTAVVVVSDVLATETINVLNDEGLQVPEDISVVGFDDNVYARLSHPKLTTIRQSVAEKGQLAVNLLMKRIRGEEVLLNSYKLPVELIVRDSVKNIN
jgi:LacI family transcriptional regulator